MPDDPTTDPTAADDVFDLDAVLAESDEEAPPPFRFRYKGETFELTRDPSLDALDAFERNQLAEALRLMLGEDGWARSIRVGMTLRKWAPVVKKWRDTFGLTLGEG